MISQPLVDVLWDNNGGDHSALDEIQLVRRGIPVSRVSLVAKQMHTTTKQLAEWIGTTERSLQRKKGKVLDKEHSQNLLAIVKVHETGLKYFGTEERWQNWLNSPHLYFGGEPPLSVIDMEPGRSLIMSEINKLRYGMTA